MLLLLPPKLSAQPADYRNSTPIAIPDNQPSGVTSYLYVPDSLQITDINVLVDITHDWIGDLVVEVTSPVATTVRLHDESGGSTADIYTWYDRETAPDGPGTMGDFDGENSMGTWSLRVSDNSPVNEGTLNEWRLEIYGIPTPPPPPSPTPTRTRTPTVTRTPTRTATPTATVTPTPTWPYFEKDEVPDLAIPDNSPAGVTSSLFVPWNYELSDINVRVEITHDWIGDLIIELTSPESTTVRLHNRSLAGNPDIYTWYDRETAPDGPGSMNDFNGEETYGTWQLRVSDNSPYNEGAVEKWGIEFIGTPLSVPQTPTPTATPTPSPTRSPTSSPSPTVSVTPGPVHENLGILVREGVGDLNSYFWNAPARGDWSYWDAFSRNPSPLARDLWQIPIGNEGVGFASIDVTEPADLKDELGILVREGVGDLNIYFWNAPMAADWTYWDAFSRNPSPLARDLWQIPLGNEGVGLASIDIDDPADGRKDLGILVREGVGDLNIYFWNAPSPGDWTYWDAFSRNPSPLARDLWQIPLGNEGVGLASIDIDDPPDGRDEVAILVREGVGDLNIYFWNAPSPGDWTYWDAFSRNPSPLARDLWQIPVGNEGVGLSSIDVDEDGRKELGILVRQGAGDLNVYFWNAPVPGDWTYWDCYTRNPSPLARDLWQIPLGNEGVGLTNVGME